MTEYSFLGERTLQINKREIRCTYQYSDSAQELFPYNFKIVNLGLTYTKKSKGYKRDICIIQHVLDKFQKVYP